MIFLITADGFSQHTFIAGHVKNIVGNLKGKPQIIGVRRKSRPHAGGGVGKNGRHIDDGRKDDTGLAPVHQFQLVQADTGSICRRQVEELAADHPGRPGSLRKNTDRFQKFCRLRLSLRGHELKGIR